MSKLQKRIAHIEKIFNSLELVGILVVLIAAMCLQFFFNEQPCPLCMLKRAGFLMVAIGLIMNLRFGLHPNHYAMVILAAIYSSFVALRHIAINVSAAKGGFGEPFLGLRLYTWVFIISMIIVVATTLFMSVERQYKALPENKRLKPLLKIVLALVAALIASNIYTIIV